MSVDFGKPLWNPTLAGFLLRVPMGLYFFISGRLLLQNQEGLVSAVKSFAVLPADLATLFGVSIPYLQIAVGALLLIGFWTTLAALLSAALIVLFIYAFGIYPNEFIPFNKDIIWLASSLALLSTGPGAFSVDRFREKN